MTHALEELVQQLEEIELETFYLDPDGLREAMAERERLLSTMQQLDPSTLDPDLRASLKARLALLHERDRERVAELEALLNETRNSQVQAGSSRRAMDGYRSMVNSDVPPPVRRIG